MTLGERIAQARNVERADVVRLAAAPGLASPGAGMPSRTCAAGASTSPSTGVDHGAVEHERVVGTRACTRLGARHLGLDFGSRGLVGRRVRAARLGWRIGGVLLDRTRLQRLRFGRFGDGLRHGIRLVRLRCRVRDTLVLGLVRDGRIGSRGDLVAVGHAVAVAVEVEGIGAERGLVHGRDAVVVVVPELLAVEHTVVVLIGVCRIGADADLDEVARAIGVGVGCERVGSQRDLLPVGEAVTVAVVCQCVGAERSLVAVGDEVAVGVADQGIGAVLHLASVGKSVVIGVAFGGIGVLLDLFGVADPIEVAVAAQRVRADRDLLPVGETVVVAVGDAASVPSRRSSNRVSPSWSGSLNVGRRSGRGCGRRCPGRRPSHRCLPPARRGSTVRRRRHLRRRREARRGRCRG